MSKAAVLLSVLYRIRTAFILFMIFVTVFILLCVLVPQFVNTLVIMSSSLMVLNTRISVSISITLLEVTLQCGSDSLLESVVTNPQSSFLVGLI
jgi:hypothetical protein